MSKTAEMMTNGSGGAKAHATGRSEALEVALLAGRKRLQDWREDLGEGYRAFREAVRDDLGPVLWPLAQLPPETEWDWFVHRQGQRFYYLTVAAPGLAPLRVGYAKDMGRWVRLAFRKGFHSLVWEVVLDPQSPPGSGELESDLGRALALAEERHGRYLEGQVPTLPARPTPAQWLLAALDRYIHHAADKMVGHDLDGGAG